MINVIEKNEVCVSLNEIGSLIKCDFELVNEGWYKLYKNNDGLIFLIKEVEDDFEDDVCNVGSGEIKDGFYELDDGNLICYLVR
jgi:hypothetical protein